MNTTQRETVADLSAQIRNRLTCIMLSASTLRIDLRTTLSEQQQEELSQIDLTAKEIQRIVDCLTKLIPIEAAVQTSHQENTTTVIGNSANEGPHF